MLAVAKLTAKNQITLPTIIMRQFPGVERFVVTAEDGRVVLAPARIQNADAVRARLRRMGITEADVGAAVTWSRRKRT